MDVLFFAIIYLICGYGSFEIFSDFYSEYIDRWPRILRIAIRLLSIICWPVFGAVYILHAVVFIVVVLILAIPDVVKDLVEDISK